MCIKAYYMIPYIILKLRGCKLYDIKMVCQEITRSHVMAVSIFITSNVLC